MSLDRSTAAVRAVNDFGLSQVEAADLVGRSQQWVSRELHKHFEDETEGGCEVVITGVSDVEHAELLRKRLIDNGTFHDHAVEVREVTAE